MRHAYDQVHSALRRYVVRLLSSGEYTSPRDALAEAVRRLATNADALSWHAGELTPLAAAATQLTDETGGELRLWGGGSFELLSVSV